MNENVAGPAPSRQRAPPRRPARAALSGLVRLLRAALLLVLALAVALPFALLLLLWRLEQGPLDIDWALRRFLPAIHTPGAQVALGHATVQWRGFSGGPDGGLELRVASASVEAGGQMPATAGPLAATFPIGSLLRGQLAPASVSLATLDLHLIHDAAGLRLDGMPPAAPGAAPDLSGSLGALSRPVPSPGAPGWLTQLRHVRIEAATISLRDDALPGPARLTLGPLDLTRPPHGGVSGATSGTLALGGAQAALSATADLAPDGGTSLQLALAPVQAASVAAAAPDLVQPGALDAPVGGKATLTLTPTLLPTAAALHLSAGPGRVRVRDKLIRFSSVDADADAAWSTPAWTRPDRLSVHRATAVLPSPSGGPDATLTASLQAEGTATVSGTADLSLDHLAFADLPALWPGGVAPHVRPWLTENITAGTARDASVHLAFDTPSDFSAFHLRAIDGKLTGDDLAIHWLRPVPPIEHAAALLTITAPDHLDIAVPTARQGALTLRNGAIHITGLDVKDQFLAVGLDAAGPVPDLLALLRHPRLNLLSKHPLPMRDPAGSFAGHLQVDLPLNHDLRFEQVKIATQSRFTGLHLGGLAGGRDLDGGDVALDATADGLKAAGTARVGSIPSQISVAMDFRPGPPSQVTQHAELQGRATAPQLATAGLDPGSLMEGGTVSISAQYDEHRDGTARLAATADASAAVLALLGWRKPAGPPATGAATVLLDHGHLAGIEALHAEGPGMLLDGEVHPVNGRPLDLQLRRAVLGPTQAAGSVRFPVNPGGPIVARLSGPTLDLSTQFGGHGAAPRAPSQTSSGSGSSPGTPFIADIRFDRVLLAHGAAIPAVSAHVDYDGRRVTALHAATAGPERVEADIRPEGSTRRLTLRTADAGAVLRALDVTDAIHGGALQADGVWDDALPRSPLSGRAELGRFHVGQGVVIGKLLQALTVYGVPEALSGSGVLFDRLLLPFRYDGGVLQITGARAFSASLGLTAEGWVDNTRGAVDLRGTVVPAYLINTLLGRIPGLGRLFSPEQGGGLVAMNWSLRGPLSDPAVHVNPLSLLTPGILRNIFK